MKKIAVGIYVVLITGCAFPVWTKPGGSLDEFSKFRYQCLQQSQQNVSESSRNGYIGTSSSGVITNDQLFRSCMNSHGWYLKVPEKAPATNPEPTVAPQSSPSPSEVPSTPSSTMIAKQNNTNVRKSPTSKASVVKTLKKGEEVHVVKQKDGWFLVELAGGETGWCHNSVLSQKN